MRDSKLIERLADTLDARYPSWFATRDKTTAWVKTNHWLRRANIEARRPAPRT